MAENIRKQFTPIRKRLSTRIHEASSALHDTDVMRLRRLRTKLIANMETHERLYTKINQLSGVSPNCQRLLDEEIEMSTELSMDANEAYQALSERIEELRTNEDAALLHTKMREEEKMEREIEKLKVETEYKRTQLGKLKDDREAATGGTCGRGCGGGGGGLGVGREAAVNNHSNLPLLTLPSFCGKITEWPSYWHTFSSLIHFNEKLSKVEKFKYLLSSLEGEARRSLLGFRMVEEEYEQAIEHIKDTYDGKEYIIHDHYAALSKMPRCSNKTRDLRQTFNFIETQIRSLQCVGENVENNYLVALIKSKLPEQFSKKLTGVWTLELLRKSISKIILTREMQEEGSAYMENMHTTDPARISTSHSQESKMKRIFCGKNHWSEECRHIGNMEGNEIGSQGEKRCFICLSNKHLFQENRTQEEKRLDEDERVVSSAKIAEAEYQKNRACMYCKTTNQQHVSVCPNNLNQSINEQKYPLPRNHDAKPTDIRTNMKTETAKRKPVVRVNEGNILPDEDLVVTPSDGELTKTAKTYMENLKTGVSGSVKVIVDTNSQYTFVTRRMVKSIGLDVEEVGVSKEDEEDDEKDDEKRQRRPQTLHRTRFAIKEKEGTRKTLRANVCNSITLKRSPPPQPIDIKKYKHIWKNLVMADDLPNDSSTTPTPDKTSYDVQADVIVGKDYYDEIIRSEKIEIEAGVFLVSSSLGWMFSGRARENKVAHTNSSLSGQIPVTEVDDVDSSTGVVEVVVHSEDVQRFVKEINLNKEGSQHQQQEHHHQPLNQPEQRYEAWSRNVQLNNERAHQENDELSEVVNEKNKLNDILLKKEKIMDDLKTCEKEKERLNDVLHSTRVDMHKVIEALHGHDNDETEHDNAEDDEIICFDRIAEYKAVN